MINGNTEVTKKHITALLLLNFLCTSDFIYAEEFKKYSSELTIYQVIQRVIEKYPALKISKIEVSQAAQQKSQIESGLGWILNSSVGVTHDLTGLGTPSDRLDASSSIDRQLKSGATISLSGSYRYEDSSLTFSPSLPNPAHTTRLDLSYRFPLSQGHGNPLYLEGVATADASHDLAKANLTLTRISLAEKVRDLFYNSVLTLQRIENTKQAVKRTRLLSQYVNKNLKLGLSENKDRLQINAQLHSKLAELSALKIQWVQLRNSLNRLLLVESSKDIKPVLNNNININTSSIKEITDITKAYHPLVKISQIELEIAQIKINTAKDTKKDNLDLVMSVGTRTSNGNNATGSVSEQDWAGAVSIQYKHLFDDAGVSSKHQQALLQKNIALQNIVTTNNDIEYVVVGLIAEINLAKNAVKQTKRRLESESLKLKEVETRFRSGRADTAQLIQFQNEYSLAELVYQNQKVELNKRIVSLQIYNGKFWDNILINYGAGK